MRVFFTFKVVHLNVYEVVHVNVYEAKRRYAYCLEWKPFPLTEVFPFSGSNSF